MKRIIITIVLITFIQGLYSEKLNFCDHTLLAILCPSISSFTGTKSADFFGSFEKVSVENIFQIRNEATQNTLREAIARGETLFMSIYRITLPKRCKEGVLQAVSEFKKIEGIY